jgi:16S rRNA (cytosine1402-N4)-methyltransferase
MTKEAIAFLVPKKGDVMLDATAGSGGHSEALLQASMGTHLIALDADPASVERTQARLKHFGERARVAEANFKDCAKILKKQGLVHITKALFDLGWNSEQLDSNRGFSFLHDEPLNMSYGTRPASGFTARQILNTWKESAIADALFGYGEERFARKIAKAIVERRAIQPIETTIELVEIIRDAVPAAYRHGRLHFATRTFQGLRIATNNELGVIDEGIREAWKMLQVSGRMVVITFHSIEDRAVKRLFAEFAKKDGRLLVKKPLEATREEIIYNPSARSAKMRAIEKI